MLLLLAAPRALAQAQPAASSAPPAPSSAEAQLAEALQRLRAVENRLQEVEAQLAARLPPAPAPTPPAPPAPPAPPEPLDVRVPPFSRYDWSWLNANNYQPSSLLRVGPITVNFMVDAYYALSFAFPRDHTIFPTTVASRHNEVGINLAYLGVELVGLDTPLGGPLGRFELQFGTTTEAIMGQDTSTQRGFYLSNRALDYVKQAAAGWHFHVLHGLNVELGLFPSYVGLDSYVPQENWNYTHPFMADFTPYYFSGLRVQLYPREDFKIELWVVNGWQTYGQWNEGRAGGYLLNGRPGSRVSLTHLAYFGQEQPNNASSLRAYTDNSLQVLAYSDLTRRFFQRLAFSVALDVGYEHRGPNAGQVVMGTRTRPNGLLFGAALSARVEWTRWLMSTLRGDLYYDYSGAVVTGLPTGSPYTLPGNGNAENPWEFLAGGFTATLDVRPSPWLLARLEYAHRAANQPYFTGPGGITGPGGFPPATPADTLLFRPDLRNTDDRLMLNVTLRL